ncbi:hypothetical protein HDU98_010842 [Podochytrium sp. JEL0797]|nr:hypothetical protein HDU98_010842 [Podochytrium sp. JEL0797]
MRDPPLLSPPVTHRIGNWCEESVLREEQLKSFLTKYNSGNLGMQRAQMKKMMALQQVPLATKFEFGQNVMIKNIGTEGYLSVDLPETYPDNVTESDIFHLTTSDGVKSVDGKTIPTARSTMKLVPIDAYSRIGLTDAVPRYGERFYIVISDSLVEKPMYLCSVNKNISQSSRRLNNQPAYFSFKKGPSAEWQIIHPDTSISMELEGTPIGTPAYLIHPLTLAGLGSEKGTRTMIRNDFGVEWDVDLDKVRGSLTKFREAKWSRWVFEIDTK